MDWDKLRVFHAVAEAGSFTKAGAVLGLSQSAVSRQVAALEKDLDVVLFHRHSRGLILTEHGEALDGTAREVFAKLAMAEATLSESRDRPSGPLVITTTVAFATMWLMPRLVEFYRLYPEIAVTLVTSDSALNLGMREADVGIRMGEPTQPDVVQRHLMSVHSHIYASPKYLKEYGPIEAPEDLPRQRLIIYGEGPLSTLGSPNWLLSAAGDPHAARRVVLRVNNIHCMRLAVENGLGLASLPDYVALGHKGIVRVLPDLQGPSFEAYFVYAEELRHSKRIAVFRDFLINQVAKWRF